MSGLTAIVDTNVFVSAKNPGEAGHAAACGVLDAADTGRFTALVSTLTVSEICAGYSLHGDENGWGEFLVHIHTSRSFRVIGIDLRVAELAGYIRGRTRLPLPDALVVASGVVGGASYVVTSDKDFGRAETHLKAMTPSAFVRYLTSKA